MTSSPISAPSADSDSPLWTNRYRLLALVWGLSTAVFFTRVSRQLYSQSIKWEQYETIFKGTTLGAALAGFAMSGRVNRRRSEGQ